jgi:hypothetical protein
MSPVGHQTTDNCSLLALLVINKYGMLMCFVRLLLEALPFYSKIMELLLYWNKTLSLTSYPCAFMKYRVQHMAGMKSSAPTVSVSVELRVLIFCLVELTMGKPRPGDSPPPECPRMLGCTANDVSTHHFKMPLPLAVRISGIM